MSHELLKKLAEPFDKSTLKWRVQSSSKPGGKKWAKLLVYIDARHVQKRLDDVFGLSWECKFSTHPYDSSGVICEITVQLSGGEKVSRQDGADKTAVEGSKGGLSDAFKRSAVMYGVGRYLYETGETWADIHPSKAAAVATGRPFGSCGKGADMFWWTVPEKALKAIPGPGSHKQADTQEAEAHKPKKEEDNSGLSKALDILRLYIRTEYANKFGPPKASEINKICIESVGCAFNQINTEEKAADLLRKLTVMVESS